MKLASLKSGGRDGTLIVVDRALRRAAAVPAIAPTLQWALDNWEEVWPHLHQVYGALNRGDDAGAFAFDPATLAAPLPRAHQWLDGSAYLTHVERVRKARGAPMPPGHLTDPLMYQGRSDRFLGPRDPIAIAEEGWGADFEAEIAVITDDVPRGVSPGAAGAHIKLMVLVNDISLRNLIPAELAKGFGFLHGKPGCAFSPVAVTTEELGDAWDGRRLRRPVSVHRNSEQFGCPRAGEDMHFDFPALISHAAKTRSLGAGTIVGSGTLSNADPSAGFACIVERRMVETLETGAASVPYLRAGERVRIEMLDEQGRSIFGSIEQEVRMC